LVLIIGKMENKKNRDEVTEILEDAGLSEAELKALENTEITPNNKVVFKRAFDNITEQTKQLRETMMFNEWFLEALDKKLKE